MRWRSTSGEPHSQLPFQKLRPNYKAPALPMIPLWSGIFVLAVLDWVFFPLLKWTLIILVILGVFVSGRKLGAAQIIFRSFRLGGAGVYRFSISPALWAALALFAVGFIALNYPWTVLSAINLGWLLLTRSISLFATLGTLALPDGQRYLLISAAALGSLVVWRVMSRNAISNDTPAAHGPLLLLSRGPQPFAKNVTFAEASSKRSPAKEFRSAHVQPPRSALSSSELRIAVEL